ncbi:PAS domain S-box protein [Acidithiobacillus sp. MC6.1]|nr:PAS domain S-box protein [Acidithiobacillus sp. MC6.1]
MAVCEGSPNVVQYNPFLVAACGNSFVNSIGMINVWLVILVIRVTNGEFAVIQKADDGSSDLIYLRKGLRDPANMPLLRHVSSSRRLLLARFMGSKAKKKVGMFSRSARGILWGTRAFFITLALLFMSIAWWRAADLKQSIRADFHNWAEVTATQTAGIVAANIDARFSDLAFFRKAFFAQGTDHLLPSVKVLSAVVAFQQTHPAIMAIDVRDSSGNRIVWSSVQQSTRRIASGNDFTPLPEYPDRFMGKPFYAHRAHAWVLTMRQRIRNSEGHVLGFIDCSFILSHLSVIHTPQYLQPIVLMQPHGQIISIWKDGHWAAPDTPLPRPVGQVVVPVPGYPWVLQVQWTAAALDHAFWRVERTRLSILLAALFVLAGVALLLQLLRRILRFRQYQMAAILAQQDLLRQEDPEVMYRRLVAVVVEQTEAIGAYVVVPEANSEWLRVVAASADTPELRQAMEALTPSRDAAHFPYGDMIPSRPFREKTTQGPTRPQQSPAMTAVQQQQAPLSRIRSVMAYPVFVCEDTEPSAVLVIVSDLPRHFTPSLQRLLGQLAATLGLALTQWRQHQALISLEKSLQESSEKNEALLNNASDGIHVLDENGFLIDVNYRFCAMLGYSRAEMLGMHVSQWDAENSAGELKELIARQFSTAESLRFETRHRCKDGTIIDVEINGSPIQIQGKWVLLAHV